MTPEANCLNHEFLEREEDLSTLDCARDLAMVQRTRRAVRGAVIAMQEQRIRKRRTVGFAILILVSILVLLAPAIWNGMEELLTGGRFTDLTAQVTFLFLLVLWPATLAALVAVWKQQSGRERASERF